MYNADYDNNDKAYSDEKASLEKGYGTDATAHAAGKSFHNMFAPKSD